MTEHLRLSSEVLKFVEDLDKSFMKKHPGEGPQMLERGRKIAEHVKISREEFSDDIIPALEELSRKSPDLFAGDIDRLYVRDVVAAVPGYVSRTLQLSALAAEHKTKEVVSKYLAEAVRTYIYGFPLASIALSRAVLEYAVRERMIGPPEGTTLSAWIEQVADERDLDDVVTDMARSVTKTGNKVLHQKPVKLPEAFDVLVKVRKFLEALYSSDPAEF
ncbi:MAG: DUF4145 domain-containing protein [Terracidiphilus sp.]